MLKSAVATRGLLSALASRSRIAAAGPTAHRHLSSDVPPHPPPRPIPSEEQRRPQKETPEGVSPVEATRIAKDDGEARRNGNRSTPNEGAAGKYEETQARVFIAALPHVARLGWTESALIAGARDVGVSPAIIGPIPRKDAALVEFFMDYCLQKLKEKVESVDELKNELEDLTVSDRVTKLLRIRLEMQAPYIAKWPQALSIKAQPANLPTSFIQRDELIHEIWLAAGDSGSDFDWCVKRTMLGNAYSTTEVYMVTDPSPDLRDTWVFLDRGVKDAFDLQKTVQEAGWQAWVSRGKR